MPNKGGWPKGRRRSPRGDDWREVRVYLPPETATKLDTLAEEEGRRLNVFMPTGVYVARVLLERFGPATFDVLAREVGVRKPVRRG